MTKLTYNVQKEQLSIVRNKTVGDPLTFEDLSSMWYGSKVWKPWPAYPWSMLISFKRTCLCLHKHLKYYSLNPFIWEVKPFFGKYVAPWIKLKKWWWNMTQFTVFKKEQNEEIGIKRGMLTHAWQKFFLAISGYQKDIKNDKCVLVVSSCCA